MMAYHRLLTEALQLCLREGSLDQTKVNIIQAAFDESVVGATTIGAAEDRFLKTIGQKFGPTTKTIMQVLNSARKRINDQTKQQMQQQRSQQGMSSSGMSSYHNPQGGHQQPGHPQGHTQQHHGSSMQHAPQSTNMMHQPMQQPNMPPQSTHMNPALMNRPGMTQMHQGSQQPMQQMMSSSMSSSGYHQSTSNTQPMQGMQPMHSNYSSSMPMQQQSQSGMSMQHPPQQMNNPMMQPPMQPAQPPSAANMSKQKTESKKRLMVQEFLNRAMKLQMIHQQEAESYMTEWIKVEHLTVKEQREMIENALGSQYGPRKKYIVEAVEKVKGIIMKELNEKKNKNAKPVSSSETVDQPSSMMHYPEQQLQNNVPVVPPHLVLPQNSTSNLNPTPTQQKTVKETKKKQQDVARVIEEKPVEERPDDMLEKVDLNDGELIIEENARKIYVSPCSNQTEQQEDDSALEIARSSGNLEQQNYPLPHATSSSSRSIRNNVLNAPLCRKVFTNNAYCKNITLTGDAQQVLSEGIQVHLKNILDSVLKLCHEKAQEAKAVYPVNKVVERISHDMMDKVALKLGPQIDNLLQAEEGNARKFLESFCQEDDRKLEAKMQAEQGDNAPPVGSKRKAANQNIVNPIWVQQDKLEAESGNFTWGELAEFQHKLDILNQLQRNKDSPAKKRANTSKKEDINDVPSEVVLKTPATITTEEVLNIVNSHTFKVTMPSAVL